MTPALDRQPATSAAACRTTASGTAGGSWSSFRASSSRTGRWAGTADPFYTPELFRATAEGIPGARLVPFDGMGHPASGSRFRQEVLAFLVEGRAGEPPAEPARPSRPG